MPRLTKKLIAATAPGKRLIELRDETLRGFHVRIWPGGSKTYYLSYRNHLHQERRIKIARCDEMPPERAREIARDIIELVRKGRDPAAERKAARQAEPAAPAETFQTAVEDYIKREQKGRRGNVTADEVQRVLLKCCAPWRARAVSEITATDVRKLVEEIRDGDEQADIKPKPYLANQVFAYLHTFFDWCAEPGIDKVPASPVNGLKRPWQGEQTRTRVFDDDELRALWLGANAIGGSGGALLKVLILTGKRKGALAAMRWEEITARGLWNPTGDPRRRRKNKRLHPIPLPGLAVRVIRGLSRWEGNPYVFVGRYQRGHIDPGSPLQLDIKEASGVKDFYFHATRHTLETRLAELRIPPHIRDLLLDHAPARGAGAGYDHHHYEEEMREALERWASHIETLIAAQGTRVLR